MHFSHFCGAPTIVTIPSTSCNTPQSAVFFLDSQVPTSCDYINSSWFIFALFPNKLTVL